MLRARLRTTLMLLLLSVAVTALSTVASAQSVEVAVSVDFGPIARPPLEKTVTLAEKSTVFDALRLAFPVETSGR
jgi:hypothetical protein